MSQWWQRSWAVAVSGAFVATVTVLGLARCKTAEREEWQRVRARAAAISAPFARGVEAHAPLLGAPQPGFADRHYVVATESYLAVPPVFDEAPELYELLAVDELPASTEARLAPFQPMLVALAAGAAADQIDYGMFHAESATSHEAVPEALVGWPVGSTQVGTVALVAARCDLIAGRPAIAVQRTADVLTLARDHFHAGAGVYDLMGATNVLSACALWSDSSVRALPAAEQQQLASVLLRLDVLCDPATTCAAATAVRLVNDTERSPHADVRPGQFDAYLTALTALPADNAPWAVREPALAAAVACLPKGRCMHLPEIEHGRRSAMAQIRLLRMAIAHHLGEPVPVLLDPFGEGPLQAEERADGLRFASRGQSADGKPIERIARAR